MSSVTAPGPQPRVDDHLTTGTDDPLEDPAVDLGEEGMRVKGVEREALVSASSWRIAPAGHSLESRASQMDVEIVG